MKWLIAVALVFVFGNEVQVYGRQHVIKGTLSMMGEEPVVQTNEGKGVLPIVEEVVTESAFTCPPILPCPVQEEKESKTKECPPPKSCPEAEKMECEQVICAECPAPSTLGNCDSWKYACSGASVLVIALAVVFAMFFKPSASVTSDNKGGKPDKNTKKMLLEKDDIIATQQQKIAKLTSDLATEKNHNDSATKKAKTAAAVKPTVVPDNHDALQQQIRELQAKNQQEKTKMDSQIRQLDEEKTIFKDQLKKLKESMGAKDKEIVDFNAQMKKQKEQMKEKDKEVTESVKKLKEQIDKLKTEVVEKNKNIGEKTTELLGMTEKMGVKEKEVIKKNKEIIDLMAQLERDKEELARSNEVKTAPIEAPTTKELPTSGGDGGSNLSMINTELAAQLMSLAKEFQSYKDTADKIIADLEARMISGGNTSGGHSPTNKLSLKSQFALDHKDNSSSAGGRGIRTRSPACDVNRGATRLAKLGK